MSFGQPYHTAEKMPLDRAREFISRIDSAAKRLAEGAIRSVQTDLRNKGHELTCFGLLQASTKPLPSLDIILSSHALIHTADGELFRRALIHVGERCDLAAFPIKERELFDVGCETLSINHEHLMGRLTTIGKPIGSPWSQDEKFAALAAWPALFSRKGDAGLF